MNIRTFGARARWCQLPRIDFALKGLGHDVGPMTNPDIIFIANPPYDKPLKDDYDINPISIRADVRIHNVLDIPEQHIESGAFNVKSFTESLKKADIITCISDVVKKQIEYYCDLESYVIDFPIKDLMFCDSQKDVEFMFVGRSEDKNKRYYLFYELIKELSQYRNVPFIDINPQKYVSDQLLNESYNRSKFVIMPSKFEGLGLPALEALAVGTVPIVCRDNPNAILVPQFCVTEPDSLYEKYIELLDDYCSIENHIRQFVMPYIQYKYNKFTVAQNILNLVK